MKRTIVFSVVVSACCFVFADADSASDTRIKAMIIHSGTYLHGGEPAVRMFMNAKNLCGGDSNRFARLLCELSQTNDMHVARRMLRCLEWNGTPAQLPYLYSLATNTNLGSKAVGAALRIEGVTSNSLSLVTSVLSNQQVKRRDRVDLCFELSKMAYSTNTPSVQREMAVSYLFGHFRVCPYPQRIDESLVGWDPSYRYSKRRLANLRAVYAHGVDHWDISYVTNAINELVAYPEQNLPE